jgi:hypothetical protein
MIAAGQGLKAAFAASGETNIENRFICPGITV